MSLNWKHVTELHPPLQTTGQDVIFSGHGSYEFDGDTIVPDGVELWVLAPPGATIADSTGQALESMIKIVKLGIKNPGSNDLVNDTITIYKSGKKALNYILHSPSDIVIKPGGPHIIGVHTSTNLSELWERIIPFKKPGKVTRCFWAACTAIDGAKNPVVLYQ